MIANPQKDYIFIPSIESHYYCFEPLVNEMTKRGFNAIQYRIPEIITHRREFGGNKTGNNLVEISLVEFLLFIDTWDNKPVICVGNDSDPGTCKIIYKCKKLGCKIVLIQDGWLDARNINNPIYTKSGLYYSIKAKLHKLATASFMPTKKYFHNFIGQNADYFLSYSSLAKKNFELAGVKSEKVFITGSIRHHKLKMEEKSSKSIYPQKNEVIVIFTNLILNEDDKRNFEEIFSWINNVFINKTIVIKVHPMENMGNYSSFIDSNVIIEKCHIKELLEKYKVIFSFCFASTVVFDMLVLNIPVVQLAPNNLIKKMTNYYSDLSLAESFEQFKEVVSQYDITFQKRKGANYLADIDTTFDSIDKSIVTLTENIL